MKGRITVLLVLGILPWAELLAQQTASRILRVSARVEAVCDVTATDLEFGAHAVQRAGDLLGTTVIQATCSPGARYQIGLNAVTSSSAINQQRRVAPDYRIYSDSRRSTVLSNTPGMNTVTGVGTGKTEDHTLFGSVPASQVIPEGPHSDTISVRIYF